MNIYCFYNPDHDLENHNIHHKDFTKTNDRIDNLQYVTISQHNEIHPPRQWNIQKKYCVSHTKKDVINAIDKANSRCEAADLLDITHRDLYNLIEYYKINKKIKRRAPDEIREEISYRMKNNNPYFSFSDEQKRAFATHKGSSNGRWINVENDSLLEIGKNIMDQNGKLTTTLWRNYAKIHKLPQIPNRRFDCSWNQFVELCNDYNHKIINIEYLEGTYDCYNLQVEENNNFAIITKITKNIQSGIILKNCGDVLKLQIQVENGIIVDAKFKAFGCGSAIAASSHTTELVKGKNLSSVNVTNSAIAKHLSLPPVKLHCSMLAEDAINAAIADYKQKQMKQTITKD